MRQDKPVVWVIGDVVLDATAHGLLVEQPVVPRLDVGQCALYLGGAGHVAAQVQELGCDAYLFGAIGDDRNGEHIVDLCTEYGVSHRLLTYQDAARRTSLRTRYWSYKGYVFSIMIDDCEPPTREEQEVAWRSCLRWFPTPDVVVVVDHCAGFVTDWLVWELFAHLDSSTHILVDSRRPDCRVFAGAELLKLNRQEFARMVGMSVSELDKQPEHVLVNYAEALTEFNDVDTLLVTQDADGILMARYDGDYMRVPPYYARSVDATGAGDVVMAVLANSLATGGNLWDAVERANRAAALSTEQIGTTVVLAEEISDGNR